MYQSFNSLNYKRHHKLFTRESIELLCCNVFILILTVSHVSLCVSLFQIERDKKLKKVTFVFPTQLNILLDETSTINKVQSSVTWLQQGDDIL